MKVFLWQMGKYFQHIVLWDGENTYWDEEMRPSTGYKDLVKRLDIVCPVTNSQFTLIGEL